VATDVAYAVKSDLAPATVRIVTRAAVLVVVVVEVV